ncbi:hypothetical protein [Desulfotomaculum copahuensis]|nr:hypothetical protein [Desulfotomaculum copahuensis]
MKLFKEFWHDADRYIVCYNPVQAEYDKHACDWNALADSFFL